MMNLRDLCSIDGYDTAILTTYQFDPLFFERVVLRDLLSSGTTRIIVLADGVQASSAIAATQEQIVELGRRYQLFEVWGSGAFHPKLCVRLSAKGAIVACGSTNLTHPGWLGMRSTSATSGNREVSTAWRAEPSSAQAADLAIALQSLIGPISSSQGRQVIEEILRTSWLTSPSAEPEGRLMVSEPGGTLASKLATRWNGRRFRKMWMATGSTDAGGAMLDWARRTFGVEEAIIELDPTMSIFDAAALEKIDMKIRVRAMPQRPRTHLKLAVFDGDDGLAAVFGSANCSAAAWLRSPTAGGNIEAVVVLDKASQADFHELVSLDDVGSALPRSITFAAPSDPPQQSQDNGNRLLHASFTRSTGRLVAAFQKPIDPGTSVLLQVDQLSVPATSITPLLWSASTSAIEDFTRTRFVAAEIGDDPAPTNSCWIDDHEFLSSQRAKSLDFGIVSDLASGLKAGDPSRLLQRLSKLSHLLLGPAEEQEERTSAVFVGPAKVGEEPSRPVTPDDIFQSLDDIRQQRHPLASVIGTSGISLAGIMRLVFGQPDPVAVDGKDLIDDERMVGSVSTDADNSGKSGLESATSETIPVDISEADRHRLIRQMDTFADALLDREFAERCTARQLQQAVAFPLVCSILAAQGNWVQTDTDRAAWREIVRRICERLLTAATTEGSLIHQVGRRYATNSRSIDFDSVIGDGTLWVVTLAAVTSIHLGFDEFEQDLVRSEVLNYEPLRSQRTAAQLAELCALAQVNDKTNEWLEAARLSERRIRTIQLLLESASTAPPRCAKGLAANGDWLWKESTGFARIHQLGEDGYATVHIRRRAKSLPNVVLRSYVNLRLSGFL